MLKKIWNLPKVSSCKKNKRYAHVRYNVTENKILQLDEKFDVPQIEIPDPDK